MSLFTTAPLKMSFGRKIFALFIALSVCLLIIFLNVGFLYYKINIEQSELLKNRIYATAKMTELISLANEIESTGAHFLITGEKRSFESLLSAHKNFDVEMVAALKDPALESYSQRLQFILDKTRYVQNLGRPFFQRRLQGDLSATNSVDILSRDARPALMRNLQELKDMRAEAQKKWNSALAKNTGLQRTALLMNFVKNSLWRAKTPWESRRMTCATP